jgi:hypothetical protein
VWPARYARDGGRRGGRNSAQGERFDVFAKPLMNGQSAANQCRGQPRMTRVSKGVGRHIDTKSSVRHAPPVNELHTGRNIGRQDGTSLALSAGDFWYATTSLKEGARALVHDARGHARSQTHHDD